MTTYTFPYQELSITDGTTRIDLLSPTTGWYAIDWRPMTALPKNGGVFRDNAIADGRQLTERPVQNVIESFTFAVRGWTPDDMIRHRNELTRMLEKATEYWTRRPAGLVVWLTARGFNETGERHAVVVDYQIPDGDDPYGPGYSGDLGQVSDISVTLMVEHLPRWWGSRPDDPACMPLYSVSEGCAVYPALFDGDAINIVQGTNPTIDDMPAAGPMQLEWWMTADSYGESDQGYIIEKTGGGAAGWYVRMDSATGLRAFVDGVGVDALTTLTVADVPIGEPVHVVMSYHDAGDRLCHFAVNGTWLVGVQVALTVNPVGDGLIDMTIGNNPAGTRGFDGTIGWLRIWKALHFVVGEDFIPEPRCVMPVDDPTASYLVIYEGEGTAIHNVVDTTMPDGALSAASWGSCCGIEHGNIRRSSYRGTLDTDDGRANITAGTFSVVAATMSYGQSGALQAEVCFRFRDVFGDVPPGRSVRVLDARIAMTAATGVASNDAMTITGERSASPATFSTWANYLTRVRTDSSVSWPAERQGATGDRYITFDVSSIVSEIASVTGWENGHDVALYVTSAAVGTLHDLYSIRSATTIPPTLEITYTLDDDEFLPTCDEGEVFVSNRWQVAQLTNAMYYDAAPGVWGPNIMASVLPALLFPLVPAANDILYIGCDTTLANGGPFCSVVFDIDRVAEDLATYAWQYYNGGWVALSVQDNTNADGAMTGSPFDTAGIKSLHFEVPADWIVVAVGPAGSQVTGYWIRLIINSVGGTPIAPTQQVQPPWTITTPWVGTSPHDVHGTIHALGRLALRNVSDLDHSSTPNLWAGRMILGARSLDRGPDFSAYLNCSDEQLPPGVSYTGVNGTITASVTAPAGEDIRLAANVLDRFCGTWTIASTHVAQYQGEYRAFLRGGFTVGAAPDLTLYIAGLQDGLERTYGPITFVTTAGGAGLVADFGRVIIPGSALMSLSDQPRQVTITVGVAGGSGSDVYFTDLVLMPSDEWLGDFIDQDLNGPGIAYRGTAATSSYLDVDSALYPKRQHRCFVRGFSDDALFDIWPWTAPDVLTYDQARHVRIWSFAALYFEFIANLYLNPKTEIAFTATGNKQDRWDFARGSEGV